jgi:hypothetical protein
MSGGSNIDLAKFPNEVREYMLRWLSNLFLAHSLQKRQTTKSRRVVIGSGSKAEKIASALGEALYI